MRNKDDGFTIEEIYAEGTPVVRVFDTGLITVGGTYLHLYSRFRKVEHSLNSGLFAYGFSLYKEVDIRGYASSSGFNPLKDWSWREIEEEADEWIKEIMTGDDNDS